MIPLSVIGQELSSPVFVDGRVEGGSESHAPGRYTVLRRLATGGMAEIYLARQAALAGFEKEIVIKRLRPELASDPRIVEMFLDEARIGAMLNHPNIVHVYDVDVGHSDEGDIPYIAMELIHGEELNQLCRRGLNFQRFLPLEHAVELIRQAAAGMGYFHAKRATWDGGDGESLEIVHCDVSPTNLLVTQDGFLKIIDFGIARSRGQRSRGDGVIPGKLSYMSPEQAARQSIDHRSDIFSLGVVLYEITVGRRLFKGSAQDVVERLTRGRIEPPTFVRRDFPPTLEAIVMRTLEQHPSDRYQSAYDLADDLEGFLREERLHSGPVRIARYLDDLAGREGLGRRPELTREREGEGDDLDFDTGVFTGYGSGGGHRVASPGRAWEDVEHQEADVAAALGVELDELRAMRTPVPGAATRSEAPPHTLNESAPAAGGAAKPAPLPTLQPRVKPSPAPAAHVAPASGTQAASATATQAASAAAPQAVAATATQAASATAPQAVPHTVSAVVSQAVPQAVPTAVSQAVSMSKPIGAAIVARQSSGAPWALVIALAAILALVLLLRL